MTNPAGEIGQLGEEELPPPGDALLFLVWLRIALCWPAPPEWAAIVQATC